MIKKKFQAFLPVHASRAIRCRWIATGDTNLPLVCVWLDANAASGCELQPVEDAGGLSWCA